MTRFVFVWIFCDRETIVVNMGWGKGSSAVYFKANNGINCDVIFHTDTEDVNIVYYTQEQQMIYDIQKK